MGVFENSLSGGSALDTLSPTLLEPKSKDWLKIELELSRLQKYLLQSEKIKELCCIKYLQEISKKFQWPKEFQKNLLNLFHSIEQNDRVEAEVSICDLKFLIEKYTLTHLPKAEYWAFEELLKKLNEYEQNLKKQSQANAYDLLISFFDNYCWDKELRIAIENLKDIQNISDLQIDLQKIQKLIENKKILPFF